VPWEVYDDAPGIATSSRESCNMAYLNKEMPIIPSMDHVTKYAAEAAPPPAAPSLKRRKSSRKLHTQSARRLTTLLNRAQETDVE